MKYQIDYICVLIAALIPYIFTVLAKTGQGYSNKAPREYLATLSGWRKRAHFAQLNGFEAFPPFAAAVIIAHTTSVHAASSAVASAAVSSSQVTLNLLAIAFIIFRLLYGVFYIANWSTLRSLAWFLGLVSVIAIFCQSFKH